MDKNKKNKKGVGLLEVLLAVAVFAIGIGAVAHFYIGSLSSSLHSTEKGQALFFAREGVEALRSMGCDDPEKLFGDMQENIYLVFKGTLPDMDGRSVIEVWFEWEEVTEGIEPLEGGFVKETARQNMTVAGMFEHSELISTQGMAKSYAYRAVALDPGDNTMVKGEIKFIP